MMMVIMITVMAVVVTTLMKSMKQGIQKACSALLTL